MKAAAGALWPWRSSPLRPARVAGLALIVGALGLGVGFGVHRLTASSNPKPAILTQRYGMDGMAAWAAGTKPAPPIARLTDQNGHGFALDSLRGHPVALVFFDSHCRQECPLEGRLLAAAERELPAAQRPVLVAVSVNRADTWTSVHRAVSEWGLAKVAPWHWLIGSRRNLSVVWSAYHIYVAPRPIGGDIQHTEAVYLIDKRGFERSAYVYPFGERFVTHDLKALGRE
jgi:cytochrome oxidase Cu insertion factor (SCO1/SenC/PrrC family)